MSHVPHEIAEVFPDQAEAIHALKQTDRHFARLVETHHTVNHEIHRIESGVEPAAEERLEGLKKQRLALLDDIRAILSGLKRSA